MKITSWGLQRNLSFSGTPEFGVRTSGHRILSGSEANYLGTSCLQRYVPSSRLVWIFLAANCVSPKLHCSCAVRCSQITRARSGITRLVVLLFAAQLELFSQKSFWGGSAEESQGESEFELPHSGSTT